MSMLLSLRPSAWEEPGYSAALAEGNFGSDHDEPAFTLPILPRSASFLELLLQHAAVDLELASAVIALDPGLAYGTLRLANRALTDDCNRIWQFPVAVVSAGKGALEGLVANAPRSRNERGKPERLERLISDAVSRACVAQVLSRELGSCHPRMCFLAGLLLELPVLASLSFLSPAVYPATMIADMCHSLPAAIVRAVFACRDLDRNADCMTAIALIGDAVLQARSYPDPGSRLRELSSSALWSPWSGTSQLQRSRLLRGCFETAGWAAANLYSVDPWNFMAKLENPKAWV